MQNRLIDPSTGKVRFGGRVNPRTGEPLIGTGWVADPPDRRDFGIEDALRGKSAATGRRQEKLELLSKALKKINWSNDTKKDAALKKSCSLRADFSPIESQGEIGSCTAHAAVGLVEYFQRRAFGRHIDGARLFVYKATRQVGGFEGDSGAYLRTAMAALALFGVPPEKHWPYTDDPVEFDRDPPPFVYSLAANYQSTIYFCYDPFGSETDSAKLVTRLKQGIARKIPAMFGFYGFDSFGYSENAGEIPFPGNEETAQWGHAVVLCGYDDSKKIRNTLTGDTTTGAFEIRNSWGPEWGDGGYGWIPYKYVEEGLAHDFWSILDMEWIDTNRFGV